MVAGITSLCFASKVDVGGNFGLAKAQLLALKLC